LLKLLTALLSTKTLKHST